MGIRCHDCKRELSETYLSVICSEIFEKLKTTAQWEKLTADYGARGRNVPAEAILTSAQFQCSQCRSCEWEGVMDRAPTFPIDVINVSSNKFEPPAGKSLLIVGQDYDSIGNYLQALPDPKPCGFTSYTSLQHLEGLHSVGNNGGGEMHLAELARRHPGTILSIGLYLVDYLSSVNNGSANENIRELIRFLISLKQPILLRFGYEFDGTWNHYNPTEFVSGWRRFYSQLKALGGENVALVWQSAAYCDGRFGAYPLQSWYPGDEYVDWIGLSYFKQAADCSGKPLYELLGIARRKNKPVIVAEAAPQGYSITNLTYSPDGRNFAHRSANQIWKEWYEPFFRFVHANEDVIRAVAYIAADWESQPMWGKPYKNGYWGDSRVYANDEIQRLWLNEIGGDSWVHAGGRPKDCD